jgi:hypothetical protein
MRVQSLLINSSARLNPTGSTTSSFRVNVSPCIPNIVNTRLSQAVIENGYYFTMLGEFYLTIGTGPTTTLTIPAGYYDDAGLCILMTTLLNQANPAPLSGSQSTFFAQITPEGFLQIINDTTGNWTIEFNSVCSSILSFTTGLIYNPVGANQPFIVQNERPIRIPNTTYLFLQSEALGNTIYDSLGFASFKSLVSGTINTLKGNDVLYENPIPFDPNIRVFRDKRTIDQVDITLKDIYGDAVRINTNNNMILVVELLIDE